MGHENESPKISDDERKEVRRILHELSNTLTGLLMNAGLLGIAHQGNERFRRYVDDIVQSGERGAALVREARNLLNGAVERVGPTTTVTDDCDGETGSGASLNLMQRAPISRRIQ